MFKIILLVDTNYNYSCIIVVALHYYKKINSIAIVWDKNTCLILNYYKKIAYWILKYYEKENKIIFHIIRKKT